VTLGSWLDSGETIGLEASGFGLPKQSRTFRAASDAGGNPVLAFRYIDPFPPINTGAEDAFQASIPGQFTGNLAVHTSTSLWGTEANAIVSLRTTDTLRIQGLAGFRYIDLMDVLDLTWVNQALPGSTVPFLGNNFAAPSAVTSADSFRTRNQFYGGQVGLRVEYLLGNAFVGLCGKVALGGNHEVVQIAGTSSLIQPGAAPATVNFGQFAGPSNIGRFTKNQFVVVPEVNLKLGTNITPNVRAFVGYDFMYMNNVVRANNQVDLVVDTRANPVNGGFLAPTPATSSPRLPFSRSDFWAQGINFGVELRY
jgi:Putative beta barrel porin-7 (BBP7)